MQKEPCEEIRAEQQYTTFERLVGVLLAYRMNRTGVPATSKQQAATLGRSSLSDWDMFILGAASKLVATGGTYPYVRLDSSRVTIGSWQWVQGSMRGPSTCCAGCGRFIMRSGWVTDG